MLKNFIFNLSGDITDTIETTAGKAFEFAPKDFVEELPKMGYGMLGIFIVIGLIIGATYLVNFLFKPRNKTPKN